MSDRPTEPPAEPTPDPSPAVRAAHELREALGELAALGLGAYLALRGTISGAYWIALALAILLPPSVLRRLASLAAARGIKGAAVVLLAAAGAWPKLKTAVVVGAGAVALVACSSTWGAPTMAPIPPHAVAREGYGTCLEAGGKVELPRVGVVAVLSSTCFAGLDAGSSSPTADAGSDR